MPRLDWIGKKSVVNHHREVPFHLLRENPELSVGDLSQPPLNPTGGADGVVLRTEVMKQKYWVEFNNQIWREGR